ncbi:MAG: DNA-3-methyladenine glycosylase [Microcoleaceae cyanobacterium]
MISGSINEIVDASWLARPSPRVAPELMGCTLVRQLPNGEQLRAIIVETEAYETGDPACHAYRRQTPRNAVMFGPAGMSYVYLIYGIYHCLNIVTDVDGVASAVLIRALQLDAASTTFVTQRQPDKKFSKKQIDRLAAGPGKLCRVMEIDRSLTALPLRPGQPLWLEHRSVEFQTAIAQNTIQLTQTTRIGISQGTEIPWRWYLTDSPAVSKP